MDFQLLLAPANPDGWIFNFGINMGIGDDDITQISFVYENYYGRKSRKITANLRKTPIFKIISRH